MTARYRRTASGHRRPRARAADAGPGSVRGGRRGRVIEAARAGVRRLTPDEAAAAARAGALLVDTRTESQRAAQGEVPGAIAIDRTVLEWRLDPASGFAIPEAAGPDGEGIVLCRPGDSSSPAGPGLGGGGPPPAADGVGG